VASQTATEREITATLPLTRPPRFTGRERELAQLTQALAGPPAVVLVEGEAGIGKTRLVQEFLASPAGQGHGALLACCPPFRQPLTLGPVVDALHRTAADVRGLRLTPLAGALRPLFPEWAPVLPPPPGPLEDATAARHRLFRALAELLDRLGVSALVVEDVHWADDATLEFLLLQAAGQPMRRSLVVTCRPEDVPAGSLLPRLARHAAGGSGLRLRLCPLTAAETGELVSSMLAGEPVSAEFAGFVHERTEGVPLAVEEVVRLMASRADVSRRRRGWMRRPVAEITVPATIREAVLERAASLGPDGRAVLQAAAVLAAPADEAILQSMTDLSAERLRGAVMQTLDRGLLSDDAQGLVSFRHALAAQAVYEAIPGPHRRVLHKRAGEMLETHAPPQTARLARHFREAGDTIRWSRHAERAAEAALAAGDEVTAGELLADLVIGARPPACEASRLTGKIVLLIPPMGGRLPDLASALRSALEARDLEPGQEAELRFQLGRVLSAMDEHEAGRAELERSVSHLPASSVQAVRAMTMLGWPHGTDVPASVRVRWLRQAAQHAGSLEPAERLRLLVDRAYALLALGDPEGWAAADAIPDLPSAPGERLQVTRGHGNVADGAMRWGRYGEARRWLETGLELAARYKYPQLLNNARVTEAHLDWFTGRWGGLLERASARTADDDLSPEPRLEAVLVQGLLDAAVGDHGRAETRLRHVLGDALRRGPVEYAMEPAAALARLALAGGDCESAMKVTEEPTGIITRKGTWIWATELAPARAEALAAARPRAEVEALVRMFARGLRGRDAPAPKAGLVLCRAILAEAHGEYARAASLCARAAAAWDALPRPYDALLARERQARCLLAASQKDAGLALLSEVLVALSRLGARADGARVARILRGHGADTRHVWRGGTRGYGDRLSPRELEVARLAISGQTNREIGHLLSRSPWTVGTQLSSAMRKLGVSSRAALASVLADAERDGDDPVSG
jgi:DNA-binding CsgD family transcriptional regulator